MTRYGQTFTAEECDEMFAVIRPVLNNIIIPQFSGLSFQEADTNQDGQIDWDEFLAMMVPDHVQISFTETKSPVSLK